MLRTEDFNDDKKDAGEIGAGHTVTALYELIPAGKKVDVGAIDDLKYQKKQVLLTDGAAAEPRREAPAEISREILTLKIALQSARWRHEQEARMAHHRRRQIVLRRLRRLEVRRLGRRLRPLTAKLAI